MFFEVEESRDDKSCFPTPIFLQENNCKKNQGNFSYVELSDKKLTLGMNLLYPKLILHCQSHAITLVKD